ncbi:MAG TPA: exonuclease domain-containing protein, partial [Polyangiaceae bacterium]|nr:exonuclease domain-containing protein [Polyangiaceae bacterium]
MGERISRVQKDGNLAWLDLEMTGLDAQNDVILQAALIITNSDLTPLEEFVCDIWQPEEALARMTPFVRDMHETTGLTRRVRA